MGSDHHIDRLALMDLHTLLHIAGQSLTFPSPGKILLQQAKMTPYFFLFTLSVHIIHIQFQIGHFGAFLA